MTTAGLFIGDVSDGLRNFIAAGVRAQTCVTSPPYWGLRDYGVPGQLGLEPTIAEYVANMVDVFRLVRDVLADDGTLWLNLGDSYAQACVRHRDGVERRSRTEWLQPDFSTAAGAGLKPKDLCGIPWRVAFALQADGWYLRSDIIWHKPNPMPESVTDRPTKAHEYLFLLSKRERYYYDAAAIADEIIPEWVEHYRKYAALASISGKENANRMDGGISETQCGYSRPGQTTRNRRTVWTIATEAFPDAHFATFPTALVEPCIMAGTSQRGHCPGCGKGWERITERTPGVTDAVRPKAAALAASNQGTNGTGKSTIGTSGTPETWHERASKITVLGWQPTCACNAGEPIPGVVLDPFMGSGTVAKVAQSLGRRWIGCELNPDYAAMIRKRTAQQGMALT